MYDSGVGDLLRVLCQYWSVAFFQLLSSVVKYACVLVLILTLSAIHVWSSIDPKCEFLL